MQYSLCILCSDLGKIKAELAGPMGLDIEGNPIQDDAKSETTETNIRPVVVQQPQTVQQRPFQPGSTPVHLMHRFMVRLLKSLANQLAASLLTTCSRLVIIKPEQAMRTHPDVLTFVYAFPGLEQYWHCQVSF